MSKQIQIHEHDEVALLLPWFVNNTLNPAEHAHVDQHVAGCERCRENVAILSTVQSTLQQTLPTPIVPEPRVDELLSNLGQQDTQHGTRNWMPAVSLAASVAALVIVTVLLLTGQRNAAGPPYLFETATSSAQVGVMDYVLAVRFEATTLIADRQRVLQAIQARDVSAGDEAGSYRMIVRMPGASLEEIERFRLKFEAFPEIQAVQVVAVQLPMSHDP